MTNQTRMRLYYIALYHAETGGWHRGLWFFCRMMQFAPDEYDFARVTIDADHLNTRS